MKSFSLIAKLPEVVSAVLSDPSGALLEASGNIDGEGTGAALAYTMQTLAQSGEILGLGLLERTVLAGPGLACIVTSVDEEVLGVYIDPTKPLSTVEKKMDGLLQR